MSSDTNEGLEYVAAELLRDKINRLCLKDIERVADYIDLILLACKGEEFYFGH